MLSGNVAALTFGQGPASDERTVKFFGPSLVLIRKN